MSFLARVCAYAMLIAITVGCALQDEVDSKKPPSLVGTGKALLTTDNEHNRSVLVGLDQRIWLQALDGKGLFRMGATTYYPEAMFVTPGSHTIEARFWNGYVESVITLRFIADSERTYVIHKSIPNGAVAGERIYFWITDSATGARVSERVDGL